MSWHIPIWYWLVHAAVCGFVLLALACLVVGVCRQPVRRLWLIELALIGCLVAPWLNRLPVLPGWSLGMLSPPAEERSEPAAAPAIELSDAEPGPWRDLPEPALSPPVDERASGRGPAPMRRSQSATPTRPADVASAASGEPARSATPSDSRPAEVSRRQPASVAIRLAILLYAGIAGGLFARWLFGAVALLRLHRSARTAGPAVRTLFDDIAGPAGTNVRLLVSERTELPLTYGWRKPVILLPGAMCAADETAGLRYCLAHEWSHVERRDMRAWHLAALAQLVFFYQPLFWWLKRQLRLCQDYLADARAAGEAPEAEDYAQFLVGLARRRLHVPTPAALGVSDRRSNLSRRITMLVQNHEPLERRCRWHWNLAATAAAVALVALVSAVRLDAKDQDETFRRDPEGSAEKPAPPANTKSPKEADPRAAKQDAKDKVEDAKPITYSGQVTDRLTGKPIEGVTVVVNLELSRDPKTNRWVDLRELQSKTDADGKYSFTLKPEEVAQSSLYIVVDAHHPNYTSKGRSGYAHSMIRKNLELGSPPFFAHIKLSPGEPVTGRVETPDGKPAEGVEVLAYTKAANTPRLRFGAFVRAKTDKEGRFRLVFATPGEGVLWLRPDGYAPSAHFVPQDKRGDFGRFVLQPGIELKGRVLDAKGNAVPQVRIEARRRGDGVAEVDEFLGQNAVANGIRQTAVANERGEFRLGALPAGEYRLEVEDLLDPNAERARRRYPPRHVFAPISMTLEEGIEPAPLEIRAVPHVEIHGQYVDSKGEPTKGHRLHLSGRIDGGFYFTQSSRGEDGKFVLRAPHGLEQARLSAITNEHGALRMRTGPGKPLTNQTRNHDLGTLEADVHGIEVVRYTAPILLIKAVDKDGKEIGDSKPAVFYEKEKDPNPGTRYVEFRGDLTFDKQEDGRWRSSQLLPGEKVTVEVEKEGYTSEPQTLTMEEGATKELVFVLEKE